MPAESRSTKRQGTRRSIRRCGALESLLRRCVIGLLLAASTLYAMAALDPQALQQQLIASFGPARIALLGDWLQTVDAARSLAETDKLRRINDFINRNIAFEDDIRVWQQSDYWATPLETIGQGSGDCEDFSIIKYVSLRLAGIPDTKLRLIYVKARLRTPAGPVQQAHMVLAYYATPTAEPLVLDNLDGNIRPASRRTDLQPVFSFNGEGIFAGVSGSEKATAGGIGRLSRWENALSRIRAEGYE
jgi:predicted transglutaminase-like cysteine proteinase